MSTLDTRDRIRARLRLLALLLELPCRRGYEHTAAMRWLGVQPQTPWSLGPVLAALAERGCHRDILLDDSPVAFVSWVDTMIL